MAATEDVKGRALELGFAAAGVAAAAPLLAHEQILRRRLEDGLLAGIPYFRQERAQLAARPQALLPGAQAVLSLLLPCAGEEHPPARAGLHGYVARYARGRDYHAVARERLQPLVAYIEERFSGAACRAFVDATPLLERAFAVQAGLGWFGKSTCLLTPQYGSWVLLAEVVTTAPLAPDAPAAGDCGGCQACLASCPTGALVAPYTQQANRCLSYLTTELKGAIPRDLRPALGARLLGCDTCQTVCPYNNPPAGGAMPARRGQAEGFSPAGRHSLAGEAGGAAASGLPAWQELAGLFALGEPEFKAAFGTTAAARAKRRGLLRNAAVALGNLGRPEALPVLADALADAEPLVRGHAAWALGRIGGRRARATLARAWCGETDAYVREELEAVLDRCER